MPRLISSRRGEGVMFTPKLWRYTDVERLHRAISVPRVNYACIITGTNRLTYVMRLSLSLVTCPCKATNSSEVDFFYPRCWVDSYKCYGQPSVVNFRFSIIFRSWFKSRHVQPPSEAYLRALWRTDRQTRYNLQCGLLKRAAQGRTCLGSCACEVKCTRLI